MVNGGEGLQWKRERLGDKYTLQDTSSFIDHLGQRLLYGQM